MDNVSPIIIMFLIAAINTFIIALAIHIIFKIKVNTEAKVSLQNKEHAEPIKSEPTLISKENNLEEELPIKTKTENEKKEEIPLEKEKEDDPKFLKYTSKGYIDPENDIKKSSHTWR